MAFAKSSEKKNKSRRQGLRRWPISPATLGPHLPLHPPQTSAAVPPPPSLTSDPATSPTPQAAGQEMASRATAIPGDLLAEIFLRLPDPADLARVSATCPIFRRLTTDRSFLRRYRKLHPPPFLGFVDKRKAFHPAQVPHPSAPAARAVALAADFSFSFLPSPARSWVIQDVRDGRVLLLDRDSLELTGHGVFTDLAVCDPLYRQYLLLPSVPDALAASMEDPPSPMHFSTKLAVFDFSSSTGQWRVTSSKFWSDLFPTEVMSKVWPGSRILKVRRYVYGCFYWVTGWANMIELDIGKMEFSITDFIPREWVLRNAAIVEAGEGRHGMIFPENHTGYSFSSDLR
uniref:Uncharacterized protein n=1 Tax=Avena sativa TaxID=4498 RepID=A0ACD5TFT5_AVESA